jgi:hypothetical protein
VARGGWHCQLGSGWVLSSYSGFLTVTLELFEAFPETAMDGDGSKEHLSRRHYSEKDVAQARLGDFKRKGSKGEEVVKRFYVDRRIRPHKRAIETLCKILSRLTEIPFQRDWTRSEDLMMKWLTIHYDHYEPWLVMFEPY